uniref:GST N-terminal domain-containing protein n=1 Tax=Vaucheria litorea TaxID=109269 RepID=H6WBB8_VAULI|nr:hypothetical protein [Vaucheria litorea]
MDISQSLPPLKVPESFEVPEPKPLTVTDSSKIPSLLLGAASLGLRFGSSIATFGYKSAFGEASEGEYALKIGPLSLKDSNPTVKTFNRPKKTLVLYEYEASSECRKVREACSLIDLSLSIRPCPKNGNNFRAMLESFGEGINVPYMIDPNTKTCLYESEEIIDYLFEKYGPGKESVPSSLKGAISNFSSSLAGWGTFSGGQTRLKNAKPENGLRKELELWGYDGSPFVKPVRALLTELELPHKLIFCARGSANREEMIKKAGRFQVPFLVDPNTGVEMFESNEIVQYLKDVYTD